MYIQWNITQPKNEMVPFAATWMDLEIIILSKSDEGKCHGISLTCGI